MILIYIYLDLEGPALANLSRNIQRITNGKQQANQKLLTTHCYKKRKQQEIISDRLLDENKQKEEQLI
jgi:hypothetical protein